MKYLLVIISVIISANLSFSQSKDTSSFEVIEGAGCFILYDSEAKRNLAVDEFIGSISI